MTRLIVFLAATLVSGAAQANCQWIDRQTADRALSILSDVSSVVLGDRMEPEPVPRIDLVAGPSSWEGGPWHGLVAHGGREINLEQVYIQSAYGAYVNLGLQVGCAGVSVPPRLPSLPPVMEADRAGAPVPAISHPRFVGLIDLPNFSWELPEADRKPVTLYSAPSPSASVHTTVRAWADLPTDEMGYEETAALILEENQGWYRIGVFDGSMSMDRRWALGWFDFSAGATAWLAPEDAGQFRTYEYLIADRLSYLGDRWDGLLAEAPDPAAPVRRVAPQWYRAFSRAEKVDVLVHETRWVGDRLWARVAVLWPGECEGSKPLPIAEGWVPAHTAGGDPVVRYYSRGC